MESSREIPAVPAWHEGAELANRDRNIVGLPRSGLRVMYLGADDDRLMAGVRCHSFMRR
jgi:hypothetical protein